MMSLSAENLQMTIQFISAPTFVLNKKGKIVAWNKAMTTLTGIPVKSVLNKKSWVVFLPRRKRTPADGVLKDGEARREEFLFLCGREERKVWFIADPIIEEGSLVGAFVRLEDFEPEERNEHIKAISVEKEIIKEVIKEVEVIREVEVPVEVIKEVEVIREVEVPVEVIKEVLVTTDGPEIKKVTNEVAHIIGELTLLILKLKTGLEGIDKSNDEALYQIQSITTVSEELASSVQEVAHKSEEADVQTREAQQELRKTFEVMKRISITTEDVSGIIELIEDVASQTKVLALNAEIEAARVGDAGRGFDVVAAEIKMLSNKTRRGAQDITKRIQMMQKATKEGIDSISSVVESVKETKSLRTTISYAILEQSSITEKLVRDGELAVVKNKEIAHSEEILEAEVNNIFEKMTNLKELMSLLQGGE
jgi:methyl-accepting chemotaxis protein